MEEGCELSVRPNGGAHTRVEEKSKATQPSALCVFDVSLLSLFFISGQENNNAQSTSTCPIGLSNGRIQANRLASVVLCRSYRRSGAQQHDTSDRGVPALWNSHIGMIFVRFPIMEVR